MKSGTFYKYTSKNPRKANKMKGTYILILCLEYDTKIRVGKLGNMEFKPGYYIYIGSALNSIENRVERHFSRTKKLWWHIDYLTVKANPLYAICIPESDSSPEISPYSGIKEECLIAKSLSELMDPVDKFGSSDCKCSAHLLRSKKEPHEDVMNMLIELNMSWKGLFIIPNYGQLKKWL